MCPVLSPLHLSVQFLSEPFHEICLCPSWNYLLRVRTKHEACNKATWEFIRETRTDLGKLVCRKRRLKKSSLALKGCLVHAHRVMIRSYVICRWRNSHMHARAYVAESFVDDATMSHVGHAGFFKVPGRLSIFSECLSAPLWLWNPEVPDMLYGWNHNASRFSKTVQRKRTEVQSYVVTCKQPEPTHCSVGCKPPVSGAVLAIKE